jgi:hypothetical protein
MLVMLSAAVPVFVSVTFWAGLLVIRFCDENVRLDGETVAIGPPLVPVPDRLTVCGLPAALSTTEIVAVRIPEAVGVNTEVIVQFDPAATDVPQVLVCEKSPALAPVIVILVIDSEAFPVLNKLTPLDALEVPMA